MSLALLLIVVKKNNKNKKKSIRFYSYFLMPHANDILNIIYKY